MNRTGYSTITASSKYSQAKELMTPDPFCLGVGLNIRRLTEAFLETGHHTIPIVDENKVPIGVFTDHGAMHAFIVHHYDEDTNPDNDPISNYKKYMQKPSTVLEDTALPDVLKKLAESASNRVFVTDTHCGALKGVITPGDILKFLKGANKRATEMREGLDDLKNQVLELEEQVDQLEDHLDFYEQVFEKSPYMIHSADRQGKITMANQAMHKTLGYNPGELIGKTIFDIYPHNQHEAARAGLHTIMVTGSYSSVYSSMVTKDQWLIWVDVASSSIQDKKGNFLATITVSRVLEGAELQKALNEKRYSDM